MDCKSISPVGVTLGNFIGLLFLHLMTQVGCAIPRFASLFTRRNFSLTSYDLWILYRCTPTPRRLRSVTLALLKDYFPFPFLLPLARPPRSAPSPSTVSLYYHPRLIFSLTTTNYLTDFLWYNYISIYTTCTYPVLSAPSHFHSLPLSLYRLRISISHEVWQERRFFLGSSFICLKFSWLTYDLRITVSS